MLQLLIYFFVAISLSMDAFGVAISLGTQEINNKIIYKLPLIIGLFHFIMPNIGSMIGYKLNDIIINTNIITSIIFIILAINIYINRNKEEKIKIVNIISLLIIAISVSIDSLSVGLAFSISKENILLSSIIFSITSLIFTYTGLKTGKILKDKLNNKSEYIGIVLMLIIAMKYIIFN